MKDDEIILLLLRHFEAGNNRAAPDLLGNELTTIERKTRFDNVIRYLICENYIDGMPIDTLGVVSVILKDKGREYVKNHSPEQIIKEVSKKTGDRLMQIIIGVAIAVIGSLLLAIIASHIN
jgi:hypothetical protein